MYLSQSAKGGGKFQLAKKVIDNFRSGGEFKLRNHLLDVSGDGCADIVEFQRECSVLVSFNNGKGVTWTCPEA